MKQVLFVYDDTQMPCSQIAGIIGEKRMGDTVLGRATILQEMRAFIESVLGDVSYVVLTDEASLERHRGSFSAAPADAREPRCVIRFSSRFFPADRNEAGQVLKNCVFAQRNYQARQDGAPVFYVFPNEKAYAAFFAYASQGASPAGSDAGDMGDISLSGRPFLPIGTMDGFIACLTQRYDARYFNTLTSDDYTVRKSSPHKDKLRAEYDFWHLLPDDMKMWFVMPYDFQERADGASYAMERLHVPNLAVKFVHNAISEDEFHEILTCYFHFIRTRASRPISKKEYDARARALYIGKTEARILQLKQAENYPALQRYLLAGAGEGGIDALFARFRALFERALAAAKPQPLEVIGHGDAGFNNILFDRSTRLLKFVDPRGASTEAALWTDPYYDVCKLSHSICGLYDFFNSDMYELFVDKDLRLRLRLDQNNARYRGVFCRFVTENGFHFQLLRAGEAALFLSMLPLHIDHPRKVLALILNAERILEELEADA